MKLTDLQQGASEPCNESTAPKDPPSWFDKDRFKRGQEFYLRYMTSCSLAMHYSLVVGFSVTSLLEALVFTERSETPAKSIKRYLDTAVHIFLWHTGDVWNNPEDPGYKSLREVRKMHSNVARDMARKYDRPKEIKNNEVKNNVESNGVPGVCPAGQVKISQYDMALVQVGFMGAITMYPTGFGISPTQEELEDYIYFWRGIGYLLGIKDKYNICGEKYEETMSICKEIEEKVLIPGLNTHVPNFSLMADAYCNGVNGFMRMPIYTKEAIIAFVLDGMGRQGLRPLSWSDWLRFWLYKIQFYCIRWLPGLATFLNQRAVRNFHTFSQLSLSERNRLMGMLMNRLEKEKKTA